MSEALKGFDGLEWVGKANALSKDHVVWDVIYRTAEQVKKHGPVPGEWFFVMPWQKSPALSNEPYKELTVQEVVRRRRSAVDMDGVHVMGRDTFYQMLMHCLPSGEVGSGERQGHQSALPFRVLPWEAEVHAALFVHRISGLPRGMYFLVRNEEHFDALQHAMRQDFEWVKPEGCPDGLPLYRLMRGDCQKFAMQVSCFQVYGDVKWCCFRLFIYKLYLSICYALRHTMSRYIVKAMYLEKPKRLIIWNGGSI
jgi:hypothetical protein